MGKGHTRSDGRVKRVNVETEVKGSVTTGVDILKRKFHDFADTVLVDMVHSESFDVIFLQDLLLSVVNVSKADVDAK